MARKKRRKSKPLGLSIDAGELRMFIDNDQQSYKMQQAIENNLARHTCRGNFDKEKAAKGFKYLTDAAGKRYAKEFGMHRFPLDARKELAQDLAKSFMRKWNQCRRAPAYCDLPEQAQDVMGRKSCKVEGALSGARRKKRRK